MSEDSELTRFATQEELKNLAAVESKTTRFATREELDELAHVVSRVKEDTAKEAERNITPFTLKDVEEIRERFKIERKIARDSNQEFNRTSYWNREIDRLIRTEKERFAAIFQTGGRLGNETMTEGSIYFVLKDGGCWRIKRQPQYPGSESEGSFRWEEQPVTQKIFFLPTEESSAIFEYIENNSGALNGMEFTSIPLEEAATMKRSVSPLEFGWPHAQRLINYSEGAGKVTIEDSWIMTTSYDLDGKPVSESRKPDSSPMHLGSQIQKFIHSSIST